MSYLIQTDQNHYIRAGADLVGGDYTLGESLYLTTDTMKVTNNVADALTNLGDSGGVIGTLQEKPDINSSQDRMVIRLSEDEDLLAPIMRVLQARAL